LVVSEFNTLNSSESSTCIPLGVLYLSTIKASLTLTKYYMETTIIPKTSISQVAFKISMNPPDVTSCKSR